MTSDGIRSCRRCGGWHVLGEPCTARARPMKRRRPKAQNAKFILTVNVGKGEEKVAGVEAAILKAANLLPAAWKLTAAGLTEEGRAYYVKVDEWNGGRKEA